MECEYPNNEVLTYTYVNNLTWTVGVCFRCNQMLYYREMPILAGNIQCCCTSLEVNKLG